MKDKIKIAMIKAGKTNKEIAESIGKSQANFSQMLQRDDFRESELLKIAEALGGSYEANFVFSDGDKI